jgi:predicted component of type VI protein secretion system
MVGNNFMRIKREVAEIIETEIERILNTPGMERPYSTSSYPENIS